MTKTLKNPHLFIAVVLLLYISFPLTAMATGPTAGEALFYLSALFLLLVAGVLTIAATTRLVFTIHARKKELSQLRENSQPR